MASCWLGALLSFSEFRAVSGNHCLASGSTSSSKLWPRDYFSPMERWEVTARETFKKQISSLYIFFPFCCLEAEDKVVEDPENLILFWMLQLKVRRDLNP